EQWVLVLRYLQNSDLRLSRTDVKSVKRDFPLCLEIAENPLDMEKVLTVSDVQILKYGSFNELLNSEQLRVLTKINEFNERVTGYTGGREISEIWMKSLQTLDVYGVNEYGDMLMFGTVLYVMI